MGDPLERYRRLRDFGGTPEPAGAATPAGEATPAAGTSDQPRFVIQQHDATRLHWDLRLERDGVLASWALPRGLPWRPADNRLAVHTEDHPLEYLDFHGEIPEGHYGAGTMIIWDRGTYEPHTFSDTKVVVDLHGRRVEGSYALFPIGGRDWMIHRMDPPQDPERRPLPEALRPMRGVPGTLPTDPEVWAYEIRWPGARVLLSNDAGRVVVSDEAGRDVSAVVPEIRPVGRKLAAVESILDGVLVRVDRQGRPIPPRVEAETSGDAPTGTAAKGPASGPASEVERRLSARDEAHAKRMARDWPLAVMFVDLLWLEGHPVTGLSYEQRRTLLMELELAGPAWQTPRHHVGHGDALLEVARAQGLRGLVAKRLASSYQPGVTTEDWILVDA